MLDKSIIMEDVYLAIMKYNPERIKFVYCDENSKQLIGRISIISDIKGDIDELNGLEDQSDIISTFKNIKQDLLDNVVIKGVENISSIVMSETNSFSKVENEVVQQNQWILETDGTNLIDILPKDYIDPTKTTSNDIIETFQLFGIEATRNLLIEQLYEVFEEYINSRHIDILCDIMTNKGFINPINRQCISRGDIGPLAK